MLEYIKIILIASGILFSLELLGAPQWAAILGFVATGEFLLYEKRALEDREETANKIETLSKQLKMLNDELDDIWRTVYPPETLNGTFLETFHRLVECARNRFEALIKNSSPTYTAENGSKAFSTDMKFVDGLGSGSVWQDPDGRVRFSCEIVKNTASLKFVRAQLDKIVEEMVAYLTRDWEITENPLSDPHEVRLRVVQNQWDLEIEVHIVPYVDDTFGARLTIRTLSLERFRKTGDVSKQSLEAVSMT